MSRARKIALLFADNLFVIGRVFFTAAATLSLKFVPAPHSVYIAVICYLGYIVLELRGAAKRLDWAHYKQPLRNLCIRIFDQYLQSWEGNILNDSCFRVSIFTVVRDKKTGRECLKPLERHEVASRDDKTQVCFLRGEGAAGIAWGTGSLCCWTSLPDPNEDIERYIAESQRVYNLPRSKVEQLNVKARSFLCIPIKTFDLERKTKAIVSVDSTLPDVFYQNKSLQQQIVTEIDSFAAGLNLKEEL
jgi:hypothetical protein